MDSIEESIVRAEPSGVRFLKRFKGFNLSIRVYQTSVLIITFIAYASFHASRKPISIVKGVLKADWAPFSGKTATARLGEIDLAFLLVYSLGMYFAGHLGDRVNLRIFLTVGMIGSGTFVALFGMGYWWNIHSFIFYLSVQMVQGLFQATGWPSVVAVVSNWSGKRKRGLIMGIWNSHTSIGNICGSLIAAAVLQYGWGWSFLLPGILVALAGIMVFFFLVVSPEDAGFSSIDEIDNKRIRVEDQNLIVCQKDGLSKEVSAPLEFCSPPENVTVLIELSKVDSCGSDVNGVIDPSKGEQHGGDVNVKLDREELSADGEEDSLLQSSRIASIESSATTAVGFLEAWMIPGVASYALCLFFSKLVAYTFLYWLPFYIRHTAIAGKYLSDKNAGNLSTLFDVGGVLGGILAGHISDRLQSRAITSVIFLYSAIPILILYRMYGDLSIYVNVPLMMVAGLFVNGPYSLITTAVSADLGTHSSLNGNSRALATVTAIIDGTGSVGAALGPLLTGYISARGWNGVFIMLIIAILFAGLFLMHLVVAEIVDKIHKPGPLEVDRLRQEDIAGFRKPCDEQLFNFGLGFGVVFMVTSSKKEIEKLRELQKQTERLVKDLKEEVSRRNFSNDSSQIVQNGEDMLSEHHYAKREIEDAKDRMASVSQSSSGRLESGISENGCNSSAQSIITTESTQEHSGMAQLEAELEAELERMELNLTAEISCELETFSDSEMPGNIVYNDLDVSGTPGKKSSHDQENIDRANDGVSPIELERRLHELLQKRQEDHITELEADLKITEDKLVDKEKELSWWKERVCQLLQENDEATTTPGDESTASMSTGRVSNKSLVFSYSCNGDDLIKDKENLKRSETSNCCEDIGNASSRGTLDVRDESSNPDSLLKDFKHLINLETKRKFANSLVQSETQIQTFGSNSSQNGQGTERKENALLCRRKKAAYADNLQNYFTARELCIDMPSASKSIAFQQTKELIPNSVFNTPLRNANINMTSQISHQKNVQNIPEDKTYSVGLREPSPPLLNKIKHWEALSRGETSSTQSCVMDNDHLLATCHHSLVSVTDDNEAKCWETSVDHRKWKHGSFGCTGQDTVGINLESISDIKLHCSDCRGSL